MRRLCIRRFAAVTPLLVLACGCTKTKVFTTAPFQPGTDEAVSRRAPRDAVYKVKWFDPQKGELNTVHGTDRVVFAGEPIGFAPNPEGGVLAFAGDEQFPIDRLSPRATYCVWVAKVKKETLLARRMRQAGHLAARGAAFVAEGYLNGLGSDDCDDDAKHSDGKHRKGKGG
jgi:hypothetical protein